MTITKGTLVRLPESSGRLATYVVTAVRHSPIDFAELAPVGGGSPIAVRFSVLEQCVAVTRSYAPEIDEAVAAAS